jgi:hypothetical protein
MAFCQILRPSLASELCSFEVRVGRKRSRRVGFVRGVSGLATSALILLGASLPANAQSGGVEADLKGTPCEAPADESTQMACMVATFNCVSVLSYGRTREEQDRLYRGCVRKLYARAKLASDATGDAVRQEFSDGPEDRAAEKAAAQRKAQQQAAEAAAQARQQQAMQDHYDAVKQACLTGQGTLTTTGPTALRGRDAIFLSSGEVVQPIADPNAVASGRCSVTFTRNRREFSGTLSIAQLDPPIGQ